MSLSSGAKLGPYEIVGPLGEGGMGEVYRARDTRLGRTVAVKVLPTELIASPVSRERFEREARTISQLSHPHICALYDVGDHDGSPFLVMELLEGETLADRLKRSPLPPDEVLRHGAEICEALAQAHRQGIVHRDLKPGNVMLTKQGVKLLDFGLAQVSQPVVPQLDRSGPTVSTLTREGTIIGTPQYMSPEQIEGKPLDARSDIFALGVVLFEMVTGKPAFSGSTAPAMMGAVLKDIPPKASQTRAEVPPSLDRLIAACLAKDPNDRVQSAHDVMLQLRWIAEGPLAPTIASVAAPRQPVWRRALVPVLAALVAATIGGLGVWRLKPSGNLTVTRLSFPLPEGQRVTRPLHQFVAISPDGRQIVYVANGQLYLRSMSDLEAKAIPGTNVGAENPAFSPDGRSIVFGAVRERALKRVGLTGGAAATICPAGPLFGLSWAEDGSILFGQEFGAKGIYRVSASGGTPEVVIGVKDQEEAQSPQLLPDGDHVLFTLATGTGHTRWDNAEIVAQSLKSGERKTLIKGGMDGRYLPTGHIVYGLGGVLFAAPFDPGRLEFLGEPVPVVEGVRDSGGLSGSMQFSVSNTGSLAYVPGAMRMASDSFELALLDLTGKVERLKLPAGGYAHPRVSPNGRHLAVAVSDGKGSDVWIYDLSGKSPMRRLTFGGRNTVPSWSPDSRRVAFQSDREGDSAVFAQPQDGSGPAERLTKPEPDTSHAPESWSPDGRHILFDARKALSVSLWALSLEDKKATRFGDVRSLDPTSASFSPDGRFVAYATSGDSRLLAQPFPATGTVYAIGQGLAPAWTANGKELRWFDGSGFNIAKVTTQPTFGVGSPIVVPAGKLYLISLAVQRNFDVMPDGRFIGIVASQSSTPATPVTFQVVLNWFEELRAEAKAKP